MVTKDLIGLMLIMLAIPTGAAICCYSQRARDGAAIPKYLRWFCLVCIPVAMVTILFTVSRAGIPIFALVMLGMAAWCVSWKITAPRVMAATAVCAMLALFGFQSWERLQARFSQSSLKDEYVGDNIESRGYFLKQAMVIVDERLFGVGLNNWSYWVSKKYGALVGYRYEDYDDIEYAPSKEVLPSFNYAAPAHNLGALTLGELGLPGLTLFILVWLRWFQMSAGFLWQRSSVATHRFAVGIFFAVSAIFLQNLVEWVYRQTQIMFMFHLLLGTLASLYYIKCQARAECRKPEVLPETWAPGQLRSA
jgi:hypothetical protein